jgi:hypothetical protein
LLTGSFALLAQDQAQDQAQGQAQGQSQKQREGSQQADRSETSMTGCLSKDASGGYTLADEKTGTKTSVTGSADLEKHSANHKVTLTGTMSESAGKSSFRVSKIQHIAAECKAPVQ